jgi:mitochondrial fission protein ELM1
MISEGATAGKPVYVYDRQRHWGKKFESFLSALESAGYTKPFSPNIRGIFQVPDQSLNDSQQVAESIRHKLANSDHT